MYKQHTVKSYDGKIELLTGYLDKMFICVQNFIDKSFAVLSQQDLMTYGQASIIDKEINNLEIEIEKLATSLLALRQPVGGDLRFIVSCFKISSALESLGDLAKNNIKRAIRMQKALPQDIHLAISKMYNIVKVSLRFAQSFCVKDEADIRDVPAILEEDDITDELYKNLFLSMQKEMLTNPQEIPFLTDAIFIAKNFERIGDYIGRVIITMKYVKTGLREEEKV